MSLIDSSGCAFPAWELNGQGKPEMTDFGMSIRDYFAVNALLIAWNAYDQGYTGDQENVEQSIANHAYQIADAMLKARKGQG